MGPLCRERRWFAPTPEPAYARRSPLTNAASSVSRNWPIGGYDLEVRAAGLRTAIRKNIELLTAQEVDLTVKMELGPVTESVSVTSEATLLQTSSSSVQASMDVRQMEELPLNGRNPLQLIVLTPGASLSAVDTTDGQQDNTGVTVNGTRPSDNNYNMDGGAYTNTWFGSAPVLPNPDTLQDFTVQASNFSARNSGGGALVEMSTRSGTNRFRGTLFEFLRNEKLNARGIFGAERAPFQRNQFGGTFGGPLRKDRTFFFLSYQGTRERSSPSLKRAQPPTAGMRAGDLSSIVAPMYDPLNGQLFPNKQIPKSRLDPIVQTILQKAYPLPTGPGRTLVVEPDADKNDDQTLIKIDHVLSTNNQITGRYFFDRYPFQRDTGSFPGLYGGNLFRNQSLTVRDTHTAGPNLVLIFSGTWSRFNRLQSPVTPVTLTSLGVKIPRAREMDYVEGIRFNISGFGNLFSGGALQQIPETQQYKASAAINHGEHGLHFGIDYSRVRNYHFDMSQAEGQFTFNGRRTSIASVRNSGSAIADALLGLPSQYLQNSGRTNNLLETRAHFYIQDDWRVARKLTLNLGLRWEPWLPLEDNDGAEKNRLAGFMAGVQSVVAPNAPRGLVFPGDPGIPATIYRRDWNNLAPRVGFAWNIFDAGRTVLRGGYGIFYKTIQAQVLAKATEIQPFALQVNRQDDIPSVADPYAGYPGGSPFPFRSPSSLKDVKFSLPVAGQAVDPMARTGYLQSWNLTLEQKVPGDFVVSTAYVGNKGTKIWGSILANPAVYGPGATAGNIESRRLYPGLGQFVTRSPFVFTNYHALQISVVRRARSGLTLLANYAWSKSIDTASEANNNGGVAQDPWHPNLDRAVSNFDVKHLANFAVVYDLPALKFGPRPFRSFVNGWQTNGILTLRSGLPLTVETGRDNSLTGANNDRADVVGDPARPAGADAMEAWFNPAAFVPNAMGAFGNSGRNILRGPGLLSLDLSLFKNFRLSERMRIQARGEAFNAMNRRNLGNPVVALTNANVGQINNMTGNPRVIQIGLKLMF